MSNSGPQKANNPISSLLGWLLLIVITIGAAYLRFHLLELKPLHHDEGVNAWFTKRLVEEFHYQYNPYYYHGPFLYFVTAPFLLLFDYTAFAMRFAPALLGTLVVPAFILVKFRIGWIGVLACAVLMAISPVEVYFSRTAIHEIYNGVFNITMVVGVYQWWRFNRRWGLYLGAFSLAILFATKETTAITVLAMAPALLLTALLATPRLTFPGGAPLPRVLLALGPRWWDKQETKLIGDAWPPENAPLSIKLAAVRLQSAMATLKQAAEHARQSHQALLSESKAADVPKTPELPSSVAMLARGDTATSKIPVFGFVIEFLRYVWRHDPKAMKWGIVVFAVTMLLLFTSFLSFPGGAVNFFAAFFGWGKTGVEGKGHEKVWHYFMVKMLWPYYKPLLFVGLPALIVGTLKRDAFSMFNFIWLGMALAAYSFIPYKTPWCVISFSAPLFFGVGIAAKALVDLSKRLSKPMLRPIVVAIPLLLSIYPVTLYAQQSYKIQFEEYDVDGHYFIYVQNVREFMDLVDDLRGLLDSAQADGIEPQVFMIRAKNPLRWYVPLYDKQMWTRTYNENRISDMKQADILIAQRAHGKELKDILDLKLYEKRWYHERPGQKFDMYVKKALWERYEAAASRGLVPKPSEPAQKKSVSDIETKIMRDARKGKSANNAKPPIKKVKPGKKGPERNRKASQRRRAPGAKNGLPGKGPRGRDVEQLNRVQPAGPKDAAAKQSADELRERLKKRMKERGLEAKPLPAPADKKSED